MVLVLLQDLRCARSGSLSSPGRAPNPFPGSRTNFLNCVCSYLARSCPPSFILPLHIGRPSFVFGILGLEFGGDQSAALVARDAIQCRPYVHRPIRQPISWRAYCCNICTFDEHACPPIVFHGTDSSCWIRTFGGPVLGALAQCLRPFVSTRCTSEKSLVPRPSSGL